MKSWGTSLAVHGVLLGLALVQFHRTLPAYNGSHILFVRLESTHSSLQLKAAPNSSKKAILPEAQEARGLRMPAPRDISQPVLGNAKVDSMFSLGSAEGKNRYLSELRDWIESRKEYPDVSRRLGQTGRVTIAFRVHRNGEISHVQIRTACPFQRLNDAAVALMHDLNRFKPFPPEIQVAELEIEQPILYELAH